MLDYAGNRVAPQVEVFNPVFDVTPADLIDVIVTERGIVERPDAVKLAQLVCRKRLH
ncbi:Methylthioribose-1-phosphate isomerase [compost metagenome]